MGRLVTITRCLDHTEALVIRGLLEQHGVVCVLDGEGLSSIKPWMTAAIHGIGVQVMEEDAEDALLLISPSTDGALATPAGECCPSCGSDNIFRPDSFLLGVLVVAVLGLLARRPTSSRICLVCRAKWRAEKSGMTEEYRPIWAGGRGAKGTSYRFGTRQTHFTGRRMDFRRDKTYHDILSEQREMIDEHLVPDPRTRWLAAVGGMALYLAAIALLYWASSVGFLDRPVIGDPPAWKRVTGLLLNTAAVGFSAIFLVSVVLWALKEASPKYFLIFGALGLFAAVLVAFIL